MDLLSVSLTVYVAIIPSILLCLYVYYMDVIEKEPIRLLLTMFFIGVLITIPTMFLENFLVSLTELDYKNIKDSFLLSFFVFAFVEEGLKYIALISSSWKNKEFNYKYDAIVYSVFISLGFATLENIIYVYMYDLNTAIYRGIISVPAHAFYAITAGLFVGLAKEASIKKNVNKTILNLILAIVMPLALHGLFDFLILTENDIAFGIFFAFVTILYFVSYYIIKKTHKSKKLEQVN